MKTLSQDRNAESGLTLVELVASMVLSLLVLALAYRIFLYFQVQMITQREIALAQSRLFPAQFSLEKYLRQVGSGIPDSSVERNPSSGALQTRKALEIQYDVAGPDQITLRGNFTNQQSQLTTPLALTSNTAYLTLLSGTVGQFAVGDYVVLEAEETSEYTRITAVESGQNRIRTETRLYPYRAGTTVTKVSTVQYVNAADSSLSVVRSTGTSVLLRRVKDFAFKVTLSDGTVDSTTPFVTDRAKIIQYAITIRIPKPGGRFLDRRVTGKIQPRNVAI